MTSREFGTSLALLTDLYQITMADAYFQSGMQDHEAVFHLTFRKPPFEGGYAVACGLERVIEFLEALTFADDDIDYLRSLKGQKGVPLLSEGFLDSLKNFKFSCDVDAIPEGTPVFAHQPLIRVKGPISQCQLIETPLLNFVNFETLVATKASRIRHAVGNDTILEFGMRRAQGPNGALAASRAAYIGGADGTSNVLAGKLYDIPVKGTHAHSWVMAFDSEKESFEAYAKAMPHNSIFLVDTYDSLVGTHHAVEMGKAIKEQGFELGGIRLDSGDLAYLSIKAREILDEAGFPDAHIAASNDLDEHIILSLKQQGAKIDTWGVGTKLATAYDQPALGGVYKLSAIRAPGQPWQHRIKLSEQVIKISNPGELNVRRFFDGTYYAGDMIFDELSGVASPHVLVDPADFTRRKNVEGLVFEDLLQPVFRKGVRTEYRTTIHESKARTVAGLQRLHPSIRRFVNPHEYPVGFDIRLHELKTQLIRKARGLEA